MATAELWLNGAKAELVREVCPSSGDLAGLARQATLGGVGNDTT